MSTAWSPIATAGKTRNLLLWLDQPRLDPWNGRETSICVGFWDGDCWRDLPDGSEVTPTHWMREPDGPEIEVTSARHEATR